MFYSPQTAITLYHQKEILIGFKNFVFHSIQQKSWKYTVCMKPITTDFCGCPILQKSNPKSANFKQSLDLCPKLSDYEFQKEVIDS